MLTWHDVQRLDYRISRWCVGGAHFTPGPTAMRAVVLVAVVWATFLSRLAVRATECNVKDYGAKGDGKSNETDAFMKSFQACSDRTSTSSPKNTVLVPTGTFLVWSLDIKKEECSDLLFNITGLILAPSDPSSWFDNSSYFNFDECKNFEISGGGKIDGQGELWWKIREKDSSIEAPVLIVIDHGNNVVVRNISLANSPFFHLVPKNSENILIDGIMIKTPESSPNTDGIDPSNSHGVTIRNCFISTGDDNVAVKPGSTDILVENCTFGYGHGCSIGSINSTGVQNVLVSNVVFMKTDYGARIKTWQGGTGLVQNITYQHLEMRDVDMPIYITMYYCPHSQHRSPCKNSTKGVTIKGVTFNDISGTQVSGKAGEFLCSDSVPCTDINLDNINITAGKGTSDDSFVCWKAYGTATEVHPESCLKTKP